MERYLAWSKLGLFLMHWERYFAWSSPSNSPRLKLGWLGRNTIPRLVQARSVSPGNSSRLKARRAWTERYTSSGPSSLSSVPVNSSRLKLGWLGWIGNDISPGVSSVCFTRQLLKAEARVAWVHWERYLAWCKFGLFHKATPQD